MFALPVSLELVIDSPRSFQPSARSKESARGRGEKKAEGREDAGEEKLEIRN
jgi:hypothetical protein